MDALFIKVLNISIAASWLILAVIAVRWLLKRSPRWITVLLWGIVALRLIMPFSLKAACSLVPSVQTVKTTNQIAVSEEQTAPSITISSGIRAVDDAVNPVIERITTDTPKTTVTPEPTRTPDQSDMQGVSDHVTAPAEPAPVVLEPAEPVTTSPTHERAPVNWMRLAGIVWVSGICTILLYSAISIVNLRIKVREAVPLQGNIWLCDHVETPFILGVFKPHIYLPSSLGEAEKPYVLAHENAHLKRGDHFIKPFGFLLLAVYWFNPLVWVAYILLSRDIEAACDEKVIGSMELDSKKAYAHALLSCSIRSRRIAVCPLAFGELVVKDRVRGVLRYKKPPTTMIIVAIACCAVIAGCFLTDPKDKTASFINTGTEDQASQGDTSLNENDPANAALSIEEQRAADYEWNSGKTIVVGQVDDNEIFRIGHTELTTCAADVDVHADPPRVGIKSQRFYIDAYVYYNYARMRSVAEADDEGIYQYFSDGRFEFSGGKPMEERWEQLPFYDEIFRGDITEEFLDALHSQGRKITYDFYITWDHQYDVAEGDIILLAADPQITYNANYFLNGMESNHYYKAVVAPFGSENLEPYIAHFVDGRLQLPDKFKEAFDLKRLYTDTEPQLTGIEDGDSIETVVAFLKAVEQDMARYEQENGLTVASTDVDAARLNSFEMEVLQHACEGPAPPRVVTPNGVYILDNLEKESFRIARQDLSNGEKTCICSKAGCNHDDGSCVAYVEKECLLMYYAAGDCLLLLDTDSGSLERVEIDGSSRSEVLNIGKSYICGYYDEYSFQTLGGKLYVYLTEMLSEGERAYVILEIDVEEKTFRTLYTFVPGQSISGNFDHYLVLDENKGAVNRSSDLAFSSNWIHEFSLLDVDTGKAENNAISLTLPLVYHVYGHNVMSMTWETDHFVTHICDLRTGAKRSAEVTDLPKELLEVQYKSDKKVMPLFVVDDTHFVLRYGGNCYIVDAENGRISECSEFESTVEKYAEYEDVLYFTKHYDKNTIYMITKTDLLSN